MPRPTPTSHPSLYDVLDLDRKKLEGLSHEEIQKKVKRQYMSLALRWHPDKNAGSAEANEKFKLISAAYETLYNNEKRALYNNSDSHNPFQTSESQNNQRSGTYDYDAWNAEFYKNKPADSEAVKYAYACNRKLRADFTEKVDAVFAKKHKEYNDRKHEYYHAYTNEKYKGYEQVYANAQRSDENAIRDSYNQKAIPAKVALIVGIILSPLIIPVGLAIWGWMTLKKTRAEETTAVAVKKEQNPKLSKEQYENGRGVDKKPNVQPYESWLAEKNYTEEQFRDPKNESKEAKEAQAEFDNLSAILDRKMRENMTFALRAHPIHGRIMKEGYLSTETAMNKMSTKLFEDPPPAAANHAPQDAQQAPNHEHTANEHVRQQSLLIPKPSYLPERAH